MTNKTLLTAFCIVASASAVKLQTKTQNIFGDMWNDATGGILDGWDATTDWTEQVAIDANVWTFHAWDDAEEWTEGAIDWTEDAWEAQEGSWDPDNWCNRRTICDPEGQFNDWNDNAPWNEDW